MRIRKLCLCTYNALLECICTPICVYSDVYKFKFVLIQMAMIRIWFITQVYITDIYLDETHPSVQAHTHLEYMYIINNIYWLAITVTIICGVKPHISQ